MHAFHNVYLVYLLTTLLFIINVYIYNGDFDVQKNIHYKDVTLYLLLCCVMFDVWLYGVLIIAFPFGWNLVIK